MSIIENIKQTQIKARKEKNEVVTTILTTLIGEAEMIGKNNGNRQVSDSEVVSLIKKFIKNIDETTIILRKASVESINIINKFSEEKTILSSFIPPQMTEAEILEAVSSIVSKMEEKNPKFIGKVLNILKEQHPNKFDGAIASKITKDLLNQGE